MMAFLHRFWHRHVKHHHVVYHPPIKPDRVIRSKEGRPLINVFEQDTFQRPDARYECSCGRVWAA
jgi:hypothetical protein